MDYEPSKLPTNKNWNTQTKVETKSYTPFASNVKTVGNNATKKETDPGLFNQNSGWLKEESKKCE